MAAASYKDYAKELCTIIDAIWNQPEKFENHYADVEMYLESGDTLKMRFNRLEMMPVVEKSRIHASDRSKSTVVDDDFAKATLDAFLNSREIWAYSGRAEQAKNVLAQITNDRSQRCANIFLHYQKKGDLDAISHRMVLIGFDDDNSKLIHALSMENPELFVQEGERPFSLRGGWLHEARAIRT